MPVPPLAALGQFGLLAGPLAEWIHRRMTPHPIGTYETPLRLERPVGAGRPRTYVASTSPPFAPTEAMRRLSELERRFDWAGILRGVEECPDREDRRDYLLLHHPYVPDAVIADLSGYARAAVQKARQLAAGPRAGGGTP